MAKKIMELFICIFLSLLVICCDAFTVIGSSEPLIVHPGGSMLLPCFSKSPLPLEDLEVEWKRSNSSTLVNLWQNGESHPESLDEDYRDRVNFFTNEVPFGNFSILITNVTLKDVGLYSCNVYSNLDSGGTQIKIKEAEWLIVTGGRAVSSYGGGDVTLNCSVDSHINPEEIEEVTWKKVDQNMLVLLFQNGDVLPDSTDDHYKDRVELFSSEINKGNFSLRLKDIKTEDKGLYSCEVFSGEFNDSATVELQKLGFSSLHICICFLCGASLISLLISFTVFECVTIDESRKTLLINLALVIVPNILLVIAFILWGMSEGTVFEALTCSNLNLTRIVFFFWISPHFTTFKVLYQRLITAAVIPLEYLMMSIIICVDYFAATVYKMKTEGRALQYTILIFNFTGFPILFLLFSLFYGLRRGTNLRTNRTQGRDGRQQRGKRFSTYVCTECLIWIRVFCIVAYFDIDPKFYSLLLMLLPPLMWFYVKTRLKFSASKWLPPMLIWQFGSFLVVIYLNYHLLKNAEERIALTCMAVFLQVFNVMALFKRHAYLSETSTNTQTQIHKVLWFSGAVILASVNAVALLIELFLKTLNGERSVDLQVIFLISESVFTLICLIVAMMSYCKSNSIRLCCFSQKTENPPEPNHELQEAQSLTLNKPS